MPITSILLGTLIVSAVMLIAVGAWRETVARPTPDIRPLASPALATRVIRAARRHPVPALALIESGVWLAAAWALVAMAREPREGAVAYGVWLLTIGPHEIGHIVCAPFGWFLTVAGGSIWQVLLYALLAAWTMIVRRQVTVPLLLWTLVGLSCMNLAPYIGDARARDLPLLFGMSKDHHDWWNLLGRYGLLEYDHTFAAIATGAGLVIGGAAVLLGLLTTWLVPRTRLGGAPRYAGTPWGALRESLHPGPDSESPTGDDLPPETDFFA